MPARVCNCSRRTCSGQPAPRVLAERGQKEKTKRLQGSGAPKCGRQEHSLAFSVLLAVLLLCEVGLPLPHMLVQKLGQALKPATRRDLDTDGGEQAAGGSDADTVSVTDLLSLLFIKGHQEVFLASGDSMIFSLTVAGLTTGQNDSE